MTSSYKDVRHEIERKWQRYWREREIYRTPNPGEAGFDAYRRKLVVLDMFPYPSGAGLHIGHPLGYIATDAYCRAKRMQGFNVLHAMGFDAFGLPAEQYAIQTGQHPSITTERNINNISMQLRRLGLDHDESRAFASTDPGYYRWTQWIFLQLFDSFYDPEMAWHDAAGRRIKGRARPIAELSELLQSGAWRLDADGRPVPASDPDAGPQQSLQKAALRRALARARLAYVDESPVNWCPMLGTVLSNEEVTRDGLSERGNYPVYRRPLKQWMLRITAYAERLLADLARVDWPAGVVEMQRNWIGASEGAQVEFAIAPEHAKGLSAHERRLRVFTTRPDTLFGATFMALAPAHPLLAHIVTPDRRAACDAYRAKAAIEGARHTVAEEKDKTGVFTGACAINPVNGAQLPIWIADYVLMEYGSGAVMGVPGHDQRDMDFALHVGLPVIPVVMPGDEWLRENAPSDTADAAIADLRDRFLAHCSAFKSAWTGEGTAINSTSAGCDVNGKATAEATQLVIDHLVTIGKGRPMRAWKLRDWLFSRQRFWGEPFPILFDCETGEPFAVADDQLPVELPHIDDFQPVACEDADTEPQPPLARAGDWITVAGVIGADGRVRAPSGTGEDGPVRQFRRELNTMPNWAGSCWYYLRYFDARNDHAMVDPAVERYWSGAAGSDAAPDACVDLYVGGTEHAVLHLLYARFWQKVLYDLGHVSTPEPFARLFNQGMITADAYVDGRGAYVDVHDVELREDAAGKETPFHRATGEELGIEAGKMGKRYKNGLPPDEICDEYSADVFRMYEMYMGPLDASKPWRSRDIVGMMRFAGAVWRTVLRAMESPADAADPGNSEATALDRLMHKTIRKVGDDIDRLRMNTALAALIEFNNALTGEKQVARRHARTLLLLLSPFAPHLTEELFSRLCPEEHAAHETLLRVAWPVCDDALLTEAQMRLVVQVNGKKRGEFAAPTGTDRETLGRQAQALDGARRALAGKQVERIIFAPPQAPKLINLVAR